MERFCSGNQTSVRELIYLSVFCNLITAESLSRSREAKLAGVNESIVSSLVSDLKPHKLKNYPLRMYWAASYCQS